MEEAYSLNISSQQQQGQQQAQQQGQQGPAYALSSFGMTRLCLLLTFITLSGFSFLYVDTGRLQAFLLMVQQDPSGTAHVFLTVYTVSVVLLFPCMIMQVISGALYGFWLGVLMSWLATSIGQSLAFLLGRYLFRAPVKSYLQRTWPSFPTIDAAIKQEGWKLVCLLRLSPVLPYNILNYALALTPVSFLVFTAASALSTIPWTCLYVYIGTFSTDLMTLAQGKISYPGQDANLLSSLLSMALLVLTSVYGYIWSHRAIVAVLKGVSKNMGHEQQHPQAQCSPETNEAFRGGLSRHSSDAHKLPHHHHLHPTPDV